MAGDIRVFAVRFLAAAPAGIAKDVDIGRPEGEPVIAAGVVVGDGVVVFGTSFGGDGISDAMEKVGVPRGGEADGLWKDGGSAGSRDTVKCLVPPVVGGYFEAWNGRGDVLHLGDFFLGSHAGEEVVQALVEGERRIVKGIRGLSERKRRNERKKQYREEWPFHGGRLWLTKKREASGDRKGNR
jgi:hypothetical protein